MPAPRSKAILACTGLLITLTLPGLALPALALPAFEAPANNDDGARHRLLMGVLGDSISAATLADVPIPSEAELPPEELVRRWAADGLKPQFIIENKSALSWASGNRISSHYILLRNYLVRAGEKRKLEVLNVAFPGDETSDLPGQARKLLDAWKSGRYDAVKYITILIGSNDACNEDFDGGVPLERMQAHLMTTFKILSEIRQEEPVRIMLVGIPRIPNLATREFREASTLFGLKCETVRNKILGFCDPLLLWESDEEYGRHMQTVEDRNRLLRIVAKEVNSIHPNLDVLYSNRLYNLAIPIGVLAADCFHPGRVGQNAISREIWKDQIWFD